MTTEFETYMKEWILNDLSSPVAVLNNFSKCPYAKTAFLENKVLFADGSTNLPVVVKNIIAHWDNQPTEVVVIHLGDSISSEDIETTVDTLNQQYMLEDFIFLDDHVDNEECMYNVVFNNGKYNVLFLQKKSKLDLATKKLEKLGYYKNWTEEYYNKVVGWRS